MTTAPEAASTPVTHWTVVPLIAGTTASTLVFMVVGPASPLSLSAALVALNGILAVAIRRAPDAARAIAALTCVTLLVFATPLFRLSFGLSAALYLLAARSLPMLRLASPITTHGRVPVLATAAVGFVTPFALSAWFVLFRPNLADMTRFIPAVSPIFLVIGGLAFAAINAAIEEVWFRGIFQHRLEALWGPRSLAPVLLQALIFGVAHWHGVPRGPMGALMAGVWGVMLGFLRRSSGGLLAPFLAHVVADSAVAAIVFASR